MIKRLIQEVISVLNSNMTDDIYYKHTSKTVDYIVIETEIFDKTYSTAVGQLIVNLHYESINDLLDKQEEVINILDNFSYGDSSGAGNLDFVIQNDLSNIDSENYYHELRFEFMING